MLPPATAAAAALSSPPLRLFLAPHSASGRAANPRFLLLPTSTSSIRFSPVLRRPLRRSSTFSSLSATGVWEDPADGYGSEDEEIGGDELGDQREEDEWRGEGEQSGLAAIFNSFAIESYNKELVQEVEQLLSPEEKAILQQNEAPDLSKISSVKWRPFHSLVLSGQIFFTDKLLDYGIDIDSVDKDSFTALHKAVLGKKEAVISHLLRKGANPHVKDRDGATPLHYAVQVGAMQTVKLLIKYKVDVNVADNGGWTPLHVAVQSRSRDIAKVLLVNDADKTRRNKQQLRKMEDMESGRSFAKVVPIQGVVTSLNKQDGRTPLDLSLCYGKDFRSYEIAKLLKLVPENRDP